MTDILAVGEILIDLTQSETTGQGIPRFDANPGGAPANLAVAASRLGAKTAFIGKVGVDSFGTFLRDCLAENGVDVTGLMTDPIQHTTLAVVALDAAGERTFSFYRDPSADVNLSVQDISPEQLKNTRILHFGSVSLTAEPARSATLYAAKTAKEMGAVISYDPNYRASLWPNQETAVARMLEPLEMVDILKVSDEELPLLTGTDDLEAGSAMLAEKGISLIFVTLGPNGAFYRFQGQTGHVDGVPCKVGDTNGAGDTFFGAALSQLVKHESLKNITAAELERIIAFANKAASLTTSRHGAIPAMPTLAEVDG
ncbi:MAG: carbohydrate kinase [Oscillospiraceae bacterium]|nr:carbohydrate kinase [Oscillospiraceae bacterium]